MRLEMAERAARELGIESAVEEKIGLLYDRLSDDEQDRHHGNAGRKLSLVTKFLPTVNIFINYASTRRKLNDALDWIQKEYEIEDPEEAMSLLATLTLTWVAHVGRRLQRDDEKKLAMWDRIAKYVSDVEAEVLASV